MVFVSGRQDLPSDTRAFTLTSFESNSVLTGAKNADISKISRLNPKIPGKMGEAKFLEFQSYQKMLTSAKNHIVGLKFENGPTAHISQGQRHQKMLTSAKIHIVSPE